MDPAVVYREPSGLLFQQVTTVSLPELFAWYRMARQTMAAAAAGDPNARRDAEAVFETARSGAPSERGRAVVLAYVLREAMAEVQQAAAFASQTVEAPTAPPAPAAPSSSSSSVAGNAPEAASEAPPPAPAKANVVVEFTRCARPHPATLHCKECSGAGEAAA